MKRFTIFYLLMLGVWSVSANPLHIKSEHTLIIDTDCAIDDIRAISLLLVHPGITIKAILVSDGSVSPADGYEKVTALLHEFNRDTIPVAMGARIRGIHPAWREFNRQVSWGKTSGKQPPAGNAVDLLAEIVSRENGKLTLICLGALTNVSQLVKEDAAMASKIERIVWYNDSANPLAGFNYELDKDAVRLVLNSGIRIDILSNLQKKEAKLSPSFLTACQEADNQLSRTLCQVYSQPAVYERLIQGHFSLYDDLVSVYITNPELFVMDIDLKKSTVRYNREYHVPAVKEVIEDQIRGRFASDESVVFYAFPQSREMFSYDVRQIMDAAIHRYGLEEWKANVMTDEFHGHLGIFSIIGAKMGVRARELFHADHDELEVVTFAGIRPPYSCLNDGIQVSTGATLGMGMIQVADDPVTRPAAIFTYRNRSVQLSLKSEYLKKVNDDIHEGIVKFGLNDEGYWHLVRQNALSYWLNWDRNEIFDIQEITTGR